MENTSWLRQTKDNPAFADVLWSRPENKRYAGKLMIAGGHTQSFSAPSRAFAAASKAGAGTVRILLPNSLQKTLGRGFPEAEFAASTPIGSFSRKALELFLDLAGWSDGVLLAGDFGKNSETAVLLDDFATEYGGILTLYGDSLDYFVSDSKMLINRPDTIITATFSQLQKLASPYTALRQTADLATVVNLLSDWSSSINLEIITEHSGQVIVCCNGRVSTTPVSFSQDIAAYASVWRLQQPDKPFEALTTAAWDFARD
jgi:NAD(P)H-hydrate repair Nnr-like enzyme with NAD(P)H-hydrate dehydratase domain